MKRPLCSLKIVENTQRVNRFQMHHNIFFHFCNFELKIIRLYAQIYFIFQVFQRFLNLPLDNLSALVYYLTMTLNRLEKLDFDPNIPIYLQIMNFVKKLIVRGILKPGEKIPSVREMAIHLGVNPNTVQKAYEELESEGVIFTKRGQGNFVNEATEIVTQIKEKMLREIFERQKRELQELGLDVSEIINFLKESEDESHN